MRYKRTFAALGFAAITTTMALPSAFGAANVGVELNFGPPPVRVEAMPPPRAGYLWAPGYWDYDGHHHQWRAGHWERERHGEHWNNGGWTEHDGRWYLDRGHWDRG